MKDKNLAAVLAFFGGFFGLHRFYLGQTGLGILYIFLPFISAALGVLDAIIFLSMDQERFDEKYNSETIGTQRGQRSQDRYERYRQRELNRQRRGNQGKRTKKSTPKRSTKNRRGVSNQRPAKRSAQRKNPDRVAGIAYFKDFDYENAITAFERSLSAAPGDVATHWNLACCYSLTEDTDKALYHLDRAVALGFGDTERIESHDALAYLRIQPEFEAFRANAYRLMAAPEATDAADLTPDPLQSTPDAETSQAVPRGDLLEQLQRLGQLREKGLLSEAEFASQKRKLLS